MSLILIIISSTGCSIIGIAIGDNIDSIVGVVKLLHNSKKKQISL